MSSAPSAESPHPEADLRCRSCGAKVRPEENWCSLCHTPVGEEPPEPEPEPEPLPEAPPARQYDPEAVEAADRLLAQLAADEGARDDPWNVVPKEGLSGRRGMALAIGGGVAFALLIILGLTLLGLFL